MGLILKGRSISYPAVALIGLVVVYLLIISQVTPFDYAAIIQRLRGGSSGRVSTNTVYRIDVDISGLKNATLLAGSGILFRKASYKMGSFISGRLASASASGIHCKIAPIEIPGVTRDKYGRPKDHPIEFIKGLKSPCWSEELTASDLEQSTLNPYRMHKRDDVDKRMSQMDALYRERLKHINSTTRFRCLPAFLIIGQAKCGTTDLYLRLAKHRQIGTGLLKEPNWWTQADGDYGKLLVPATLQFPAYVDLYGFPAMQVEEEWMEQCDKIDQRVPQQHKCDQSITGEASVATLTDFNPSVRMKIFGQDFFDRYPLWHHDTKSNYVKWVLPDAKIIIILRDPTLRLFSDYLFNDKKMKANQRDFHNKVVRSIAVYQRCLQNHEDQFCVYDRETRQSLSVRLHFGLYSLVVAEWIQTFPKHQLLIVRMEDYSTDMRRTLRRVYDFLGICYPSPEDENFIVGMKLKNKGHQQIGPMWNSTRRLLDDFYVTYNRELSVMLNDERFLWNDTRGSN